jgi:hypothetical protein
MRNRRFRVGLSVTLLLLGAAGLGEWWFVLRPLFNERRPFVGTWRLERLGSSPLHPSAPWVVLEMDLLLDGTSRVRQWDSRTGAVLYDELERLRWRVGDGRLQEFEISNLLFAMVNQGGIRVVWDRPVTWDGPDRFLSPSYSPSGPTIVWTRCDRASGR